MESAYLPAFDPLPHRQHWVSQYADSARLGTRARAPTDHLSIDTGTSEECDMPQLPKTSFSVQAVQLVTMVAPRDSTASKNL